MKISRPIKLIFWLALLAICIYIKYTLSESSFSPEKSAVIGIVLNLAILLLALRSIIEFLILWYRLSKKLGSQNFSDNIVVGLTNLFTLISIIATLFTLMSLSGLDLKDVFTTLSIVAAAIAIITKDFITEIIIGIVNGFSSKIELEDYVKINDQKGKIIDIGLQKLTLLNDEDDLIYIPNVKFYNSEITNYTRKDIRRMGVDFQLDLKYLTNIEDLETKLAMACEEMSEYIEPDSINLKVMNITKDTIDLKFQYTMKEVSREVHRKIRKIILRTLANIVGTGIK